MLQGLQLPLVLSTRVVLFSSGHAKEKKKKNKKQKTKSIKINNNRTEKKTKHGALSMLGEIVQYFESPKLEIETKNSIARAAPPPPQGHDSDVSALFENTVNCLRARVGNQCTHALTHTYASRANHQRTQTRLAWDLSLVFLMLLVSMLPNFCSGAFANTHPQSCSRTNRAAHLDQHTVIVAFSSTTRSILHYLTAAALTSNPSVYGAIPSGARKCRWRMSRTVSHRRQLLPNAAWTDIGVGRIARHRHGAYIRRCAIIQRGHLEMGPVKRDRHDWYVHACIVV